METSRAHARHRAARLRRRWPLLAAWAASRAFSLGVLAGVIPLTKVAVLSDVSVIYQHWYQVLQTGHYPIGDVTWQYPPLTALVIIAPGLLPIGYAHAFIALAVAFDVLGLWLLIRADRGLIAAWYWVIGIGLIGPTTFARYDVIVTVVAIAGLLALARRPIVGGVLAGVGLLLKVWPAFILVGTPRGPRTRKAWLSAAGTVAVLSLAADVAVPGAFSFLSAQQSRGVEIESLGGMVFQVAKKFGWHGRVKYHYGSMEFIGSGVSQVATASLVLGVVAACWLLLWRVRARHFGPAATVDAALTATLLFVVTSRVISPQYLIWLLGLAAVCLAVRGTSQRKVALLLLPAAGLTLLEFPLLFQQVIESRPIGVAVIVLRNLLLLAAALLSCARLWRSTSLVPSDEPLQVPVVDEPADVEAGRSA